MVNDKQTTLGGLRRLARAYGIQTHYTALDGKRSQASVESLRAVLAALGVPAERLNDSAGLLRERLLEPWRRLLQPVSVVWGRGAGQVEVFPSPEGGDGPVRIEVATEQGERHQASFPAEALRTVRTVTVDGRAWPVKAVPLPRLPFGYHTLRLEAGGRTAEAMVIAAPRKACEPRGADRLWGAFLPLYALRTEHGWGAGDLGDFARLVDWVKDLGGGVTATLPLLATFLDEPFDPSPYVPASRLFWNEFYIDMEAVPELAASPEARATIEAEAFQRAIGEMRQAPVADYRRLMELKERVLRVLAREFFERRGEMEARWERFQTFLRESPKAGDYAAFRAACRRQHGAWQSWPQAMKDGTLTPADYDGDTRRYYLYAQFIVQEQMDRLSNKARQGGPGLYLDLPLGVNSDSYDVWRERDSFAWGVSGGAPPDPFFSKGQDWGFAPLHPLKMRERRYGYIIECVRRLMSQAGVVRIDHVMGLHRLYWVPRGMEATQGVYVEYPAGELHAILNVESHRYRSMIVGEDLGTVPGQVRRAMKRHNIHGMYVLQFSVHPGSERLVAPVPEGVVASTNTHDMPSFAGFWQGKDIDDQVDLGLVAPVDEEAARVRRMETLEALVRYFEREKLLPADSHEAAAELPALATLRAMLEFLGRAPARIVLVNLEDLWQELRQQNVPGTCTERQNWRHKARYSLEVFSQLPAVRDLLGALDGARKEAPGQPGVAREPRA